MAAWGARHVVVGQRPCVRDAGGRGTHITPTFTPPPPRNRLVDGAAHWVPWVCGVVRGLRNKSTAGGGGGGRGGG